MSHISPGTIRLRSRFVLPSISAALAMMVSPDFDLTAASLAPEDATPTTNDLVEQLGNDRRNGSVPAPDLYVAYGGDGRVIGFHSAADSGTPGETTAWRSGFGTKERLLFYNPNGSDEYTYGTADLYLEDGSVVHFDRYTDLIESKGDRSRVPPREWRAFPSCFVT